MEKLNVETLNIKACLCNTVDYKFYVKWSDDSITEINIDPEDIASENFSPQIGVALAYMKKTFGSNKFYRYVEDLFIPTDPILTVSKFNKTHSKEVRKAKAESQMEISDAFGDYYTK